MEEKLKNISRDTSRVSSQKRWDARSSFHFLLHIWLGHAVRVCLTPFSGVGHRPIYWYILHFCGVILVFVGFEVLPTIWIYFYDFDVWCQQKVNNVSIFHSNSFSKWREKYQSLSKVDNAGGVFDPNQWCWLSTDLSAYFTFLWRNIGFRKIWGTLTIWTDFYDFDVWREQKVNNVSIFHSNSFSQWRE